MAHTLYELDVRLREIEPPIWRTVEVPGSWSLEDVHYALQVAMGWTNSHLHQFIIGKTSYGMADVDDSGDLEFEDEREFRLQDLVRSGESFLYEYDFGDSWEHVVSVSKVTSVAKAPKARCTAGSRACPPEDCGGVGGYQHLLAVLADPRHEEHEEMVQWSQDFAPERFSLPKNGLDLGPEMKRFKALAEGDDPFDEDFDDDAAVDNAVVSLPRSLVDVVLALPPAERAALGAMITESLAAELVEVRRAAGQLVGSLARQHKKKPARGHGKRGRS